VDEETFKRRTKQFALRAMELVDALPKKPAANVIGRQRLRSSTSVGANYRSACRGRSTADVMAKLAIVEEEADESMYWLELLVDSNLVAVEEVRELQREANELVAMAVASIKTLRSRSR
jgi:four helix bundle protein